MTWEEMHASAEAADEIEALNHRVAEIVDAIAAAEPEERVGFQATPLEMALALRELRRRYDGQGMTFNIEVGEGEGPVVYERQISLPAGVAE